MIYAVFGALTGMHGRAESHQLRLKHQALAAAALGRRLRGSILIGVPRQPDSTARA